MKTLLAAPRSRDWEKRLITLALFSHLIAAASGAVFSGANDPGGSTVFTFDVPANTSGISVRVDNDPAAFSQLLLKRGGTPDSTDYDYATRAYPSETALNLEGADLTPGVYGVRVATPADSARHSFTLDVELNPAGLRGEALPAAKPRQSHTQGELAPGARHYFRVEIPAGSPGWRAILGAAGGGLPDLYLKKGGIPSEFDHLKASVGQEVDTLVLNEEEATPGSWYVGVFLPLEAVPANYTLALSDGYFTELGWDDGGADAGTAAAELTDDLGGDHYFKITPNSTPLASWRVALAVLAGEADLYLSQGSLPTPASHQYKSERAGSDGFFLATQEFQPGQTWFLMVRSKPGSRWRLVSGTPFVQDLGVVASDESSGSGMVRMGPEGIRFFKTQIAAETLAWRLWVPGVSRQLRVSRAGLPTLWIHDRQRDAQMLLVPDYLATGQTYYVSVTGDPGVEFNLDSRQQEVGNIDFLSQTSVTVSGYGYQTYRVDVPLEQIAWQISALRVSGDASVAVRRGRVPNEDFNDGYSEAPSPASDSLTLVPPNLSDGAFYITVYGVGAYKVTLVSGNPVITDIPYVGSIVNDDPTRAGWRFYRVANIEQQLGTLGWDLLLENQMPGTELALRRNGVPGRWNYREDGGSGERSQMDYSGTAGFLQRPAHQSDIWYVGVYTPQSSLGSFKLTSRHLTFEPLGFNNASLSRAQVTPGKWQFFRVDVPSGVLGWDLRLASITSGTPSAFVRRDQLPDGNSSGLYDSPTWPSGASWALGIDWTELYYTPGGVDEKVRMMGAGFGRPLQTGTYYVGVINDASDSPATYRVVSRAIAAADSPILVKDLAFSGGVTPATALPAREAEYYKVVVPTGAKSWKLRLRQTAGESGLMVARGAIPNIGSAVWKPAATPASAGRKLQRLGNEHFVLLPEETETSLQADTYYLAVVSEGVNPDRNQSRIGGGSSEFVLESQGELPVENLGDLGAAGLTRSLQLEGGEIRAYRFQVPDGTPAFEVELADRVGGLVAAVAPGAELPSPVWWRGWNEALYGVEGGVQPGSPIGSAFVTVPNPVPGEYRLVVQASINNEGRVVDGASLIRIVQKPPQGVDFASGLADVLGQKPDSWRFFLVVVPEGADGWDIRMENVTTGDPQMVVSRDALPGSIHGNLADSTEWPSGASWAAGPDWTAYYYDSAGARFKGSRLAMGMGRPLQPGVYQVGVFVPPGSEAASYTVASLGIGADLPVKVETLEFSGGSTDIVEVEPREARYYRVSVPAGAKRWKVALEAVEGDVTLVAGRGSLPNTGATMDRSAVAAASAGKKMQKPGGEVLNLLPASGELELPPGDYYLVVAGEGVGANLVENRIGAGTARFKLRSFGDPEPMPLGELGSTPLTASGDLAAGDLATFTFRVPEGASGVEATLTSAVGNAILSLRPGEAMPPPELWRGWWQYYYGLEGGESAGAIAHAGLITLANPAPGIYSVGIRASHSDDGIFRDTAYALTIAGTGAQPLVFDGGRAEVALQAPGSWRFFEVNVPEACMGWDLRLTGVTGGAPHLVVRRDDLPNTTAGNLGSSPNWPAGETWGVQNDWTGYYYAADGGQFPVTTLATGRRPLQAGNYKIGVLAPEGAAPTSYSIVSRGIGDGFSIEVRDLDFSAGEARVEGLAAHEAAYFRVRIPFGAPSWRLALESTQGDALLAVRKEFLPNVSASADQSLYNEISGGKRVQKGGSEHFLLLPNDGSTELAAGSYFVAVISEGANPDPSAGRIGVGGASFALKSLGALPVGDFGELAAEIRVNGLSIPGGSVIANRFTLPPGVPALEVRLDSPLGAPWLALRPGSGLPMPSGWWWWWYGHDGGQTAGRVEATDILTIPAPVPGVYSTTLKASQDGADFPDARVNLILRRLEVGELNFSADDNGNGRSHTASGVLLDNQRNFYRVEVPSQYRGVPLLGWRLDLAETQGTAEVRVRKGALPSDFEGGIGFSRNSAVIAPPFLTPGTWYVEVKGTGATAYTLSSGPQLLTRAAWTMQLPGQPSPTPGLSGSTFGDTGVDPSGVPLPGDQGVDLARGKFHYYAIEVPPGNGGLLRTVLEAISGRPALYIRHAALPTLAHTAEGSAGTLYQRVLQGEGSQYGNWVPAYGRDERELAPGIWYLAIHASGDSNVRYRLRSSLGSVTPLAFTGGAVTKQTLAAGDWRYYRVEVPVNAPAEWRINYTHQSGEARMYLRDTLPPGAGNNAYWWEQIVDWTSDGKHSHSGALPQFEGQGTHVIQSPPLRPGQVYYVGFLAVRDSTFSVSTTSAGPAQEVPSFAFYGGSFSTVIPAGGIWTVRVQVPIGGVRWVHHSTHAESVNVFIQQGSVFAVNGGFIWQSGSVANSSISQPLNGWPWVAGQWYWVSAVNTSGQPQSFSMQFDGRNETTDDEDGDGLPDSWEMGHFGGTAFGAQDDSDNDGNTNLVEYQRGTNPSDAASYSPRLAVVSADGAVLRNPDSDYFPLNSFVTLTAQPNPGLAFDSWFGAANSAENPLVLFMDGHKSITARYHLGNDAFANRFQIMGVEFTVVTSNTGGSREPGEPVIAGVQGGASVWWTWTAPRSGLVTISTSGSVFDTILGVFTGSDLSTLVPIASNDDFEGQAFSQVTFAAAGGVEYQIGVDGWNGVQGSLRLSLSMRPAPTVEGRLVAGGSKIELTITGSAGESYRVEQSENLTQWSEIGQVANPGGVVQYLVDRDPAATARFFRVVSR